MKNITNVSNIQSSTNIISESKIFAEEIYRINKGVFVSIDAEFIYNVNLVFYDSSSNKKIIKSIKSAEYLLSQNDLQNKLHKEFHSFVYDKGSMLSKMIHLTGTFIIPHKNNCIIITRTLCRMHRSVDSFVHTSRYDHDCRVLGSSI